MKHRYRRARPILVVALGLILCGAGLAADTEEAQYNVVANLYNAGQWKAALKKIGERENLPDLTDAMRLRYRYAKGMALEKDGRIDEAHETYRALIAKFPNATESRKAKVALIYLDYAARKFDAVVAGYEALDKSILEAGDKPNVTLMYAEALYARNNFKDALAAYQSALALGADRNAVSAKLFDLYYQAGQHQPLLALTATPVPGIEEDLAAMARAEALLALGKVAEAAQEARKVRADSAHYPRACFTLAQALMKQNNLRDAVAPLETAVKGLKNPPAPPAARLALAECLLAAARTNDALKAQEQAVAMAGNLPEAEKLKLLEQAAVFRVGVADKANNPRLLVKAVAEARPHLPKDKLPEVLYLKLFALAQARDGSAILQAFQDDYQLLQGTPRDGAATLVFFGELKNAGRLDDGLKMLEDFMARRPPATEAARARLEIANIHLQRDDFAKAHAAFKELLAAPGLQAALGQEIYSEFLYNSAVAAIKQAEPDAAIKSLTDLSRGPCAPALLARGRLLLGQVYTAKNDFKNAAAVWKQILADGKVEKEGEIRIMLAKALFALNDFAGARAQFEAAGKLAGGDKNLARDSREIWARASFNAGDFAGAAAGYRALFEAYDDAPTYAYECAVSHERAGAPVEAEKWFTAAAKDKKRLPSEYALAVDYNLARLRLQTGTGDRGLSYWLSFMVTNSTAAEFETAITALARITTTDQVAAVAGKRLESQVRNYDARNPRYYAIGAILLQCLAAESQTSGIKRWSELLAADLATNEAAVAGKTFAGTLAPAMIYYYRGEADRLAGNPADALASFETVLAAYPYNEWPDAAAFGAAECYAALGDLKTARAKLEELTRTTPANPGSAAWRDRATQRLTTLAKESSQ